MLLTPVSQGISGDGEAPNIGRILERGAKPPEELGTEMHDCS